MLAYGYGWDDDQKSTVVLREASMACTRQELNELIEFLQEIQSTAEDLDDADGEHWHFRDWCRTWSARQSDLIVFLTEESKETVDNQSAEEGFI